MSVSVKEKKEPPLAVTSNEVSFGIPLKTEVLQMVLGWFLSGAEKFIFPHAHCYIHVTSTL